MNHYTQILSYIKELAESDPLVNKVTQGNLEEVDFNKISLVPLVHITVNSGSFTNGKTVNFNIELAAMSIIDNVNEQTTDEFYFNNSEVDIYNETLAILNRMFSVMVTDFTKAKIKASENPSYNKVDGVGANGLQGWLLTFDVEIPNDKLSLCQYPI